MARRPLCQPRQKRSRIRGAGRAASPDGTRCVDQVLAFLSFFSALLGLQPFLQAKSSVIFGRRQWSLAMVAESWRSSHAAWGRGDELLAPLSFLRHCMGMGRIL